MEKTLEEQRTDGSGGVPGSRLSRILQTAGAIISGDRVHLMALLLICGSISSVFHGEHLPFKHANFDILRIAGPEEISGAPYSFSH